ncbi:hypothetical protein K435DRAFT_892366 [Dendrothele bispora CBS 962.96]|uniref:Uncharacterized protein n=1 Tax=Dendrothele bispora (strain CBS 962.96) TaxID=1314807 RepID=A0A4S8M3J4_DENBC|nr:hypothetical protein K435DRAFT_892366 [Dendrothele bispora CBS 962.96]
MRQCLVILEWQAQDWLKNTVIDTFEDERRKGLAVYVHEQAAVHCHIAERFSKLWEDSDVVAARQFDPGTLDLEKIFGSDACAEDSDEEKKEMEIESGTMESEDKLGLDEEEDDVDLDEDEQEDGEDEKDELEQTMEGEEEGEMEVDDENEDEEECGYSLNEILTAVEEAQEG